MPLYHGGRELASAPEGHAGVTRPRPRPQAAWCGQALRKDRGLSAGTKDGTRRRPGRPAPALDHEAVLLPVVRHEDDIAVGSPDEAGQSEGVVGAGRGGLHGRHLVGLNAAQLGGRVEHADAPQQRGVHLEGHRDTKAHGSLTEPSAGHPLSHGADSHSSGSLFSAPTGRLSVCLTLRWAVTVNA